MILTNCAACAVPLPHPAKQCSRCKTRYCGPACQEQHWKGGGHDLLCKKIKKGGGAEQYHADKKTKEAVAVAVEKCAADTKGQTCFICTQALHWKTKEGLVRMCACRGTAGFAHVSCLAEQAKILVAEVEENNLGLAALDERFRRWYTCSLCEQQYHGAVVCALSWACWKTYVGRPEADIPRQLAMSVLGNGLASAGHHEDALSVREAELSMRRRRGSPEVQILAVQNNLANTYQLQGRFDKSLHLRQEVYSGHLRLSGEEHGMTLAAANNYAYSLLSLRRFDEAKSVLRRTVPVARHALGESHLDTLRMRMNYAQTLYRDEGATLDDLREALTTLEDTARTARRVLGGEHPLTVDVGACLRRARAALRAREAPPSGAQEKLASSDDAPS